MARPRTYEQVKGHSESDAWHITTQKLWDNGQYRIAFRRLLKAARRGDTTAQVNLGYLYDYGIGVARKQRLAIHRYRRAYKQGCASAAINMGTVYRDRGDFHAALMWFERSVAMGDLSAHWNIAKLYFKQRRDIAKSILYFRHVAQAKRGVDVSPWELDTAIRCLRWLERLEIAV